MLGEGASKDIDKVFKKHNALGNKTQSMSKPVFTSRNLSSNASPSPNRFQKNALTTNAGSNAEIKGVTSSKIDKLRFAKFRNGSSYIKTGQTKVMSSKASETSVFTTTQSHFKTGLKERVPLQNQGNHYLHKYISEMTKSGESLLDSKIELTQRK